VTGVAIALNEIEHPYRVDRVYNLIEAREYCERLAKSHYENFLVAGIFCPKPLRKHFYHIYAYCRISDDLGDEIGDTQKSLILLNWWEEGLHAMYAGEPRHPAFVALEETVKEFDIPVTPFRNLLTAFRQDQTMIRYPTFQDLLGYCVNSANPVGQLVLYLCGYRDAERFRLSDKTCTALQLANFWQDVTRDLEKNRIYIPLEDMERYGYQESLLWERRFTPQFADLMRFEVERTKTMFTEGLGLCPLVERRVRLDVEMFSRGGMEVLRMIEAQGYDVLSHRPTVSKKRQIALLFGRLLANITQK
jgi:squalene synthase HpnC